MKGNNGGRIFYQGMWYPPTYSPVCRNGHERTSDNTFYRVQQSPKKGTEFTHIGCKVCERIRHARSRRSDPSRIDEDGYCTPRQSACEIHHAGIKSRWSTINSPIKGKYTQCLECIRVRLRRSRDKQRGGPAWGWLPTHCPKGHEFTLQNTGKKKARSKKPGKILLYRYCLTCHRDRQREYQRVRQQLIQEHVACSLSTTGAETTPATDRHTS